MPRNVPPYIHGLFATVPAAGWSAAPSGVVTDFSASNPTVVNNIETLANVPLIVLEGGEAVFDSRVIVEYVDTLSPVGKLIPSSGRERAEVRTWEALADGLMDAAILARLEQTWGGRRDGERSQAWIDRQMGKIDAALAALTKGLGDKPFCAGIHLTLADIAVGCAVGYLDFRFPQIDWRRRHLSLAGLADKLALRQSFIDSAPPKG